MRGDKLFWIHLKHFKNCVISYYTKFLNELLDDFDANVLNIFHSNKLPSPNVSDSETILLCVPHQSLTASSFLFLSLLLTASGQ